MYSGILDGQENKLCTREQEVVQNKGSFPGRGLVLGKKGG
jgi:hypothetical protein